MSCLYGYPISGVFIKFYVKPVEHLPNQLLLKIRNTDMTATYIYHSCYLLTFDGVSILFDYYKDAPREDGSGWVKDYLLNREEDLYVLCSHSHCDHFNPEILSWKKRKKNIRYIFSRELQESGKTAADDALYLDKEEVYRDHRLTIKAFGSTDVGSSFLVEYNNRRFFHAGDLNNWHWNEEVDKEEALSYENHFLCELELLAEENDRLYLAMFPVDPRLGKDFMRGAEQFVSRIKTAYFLPMHFGENYDKADLLGKIAARHGCRVLPLSHRGQSYALE
jgi:L-ascorbate metabolism protein UlaG (beta-lactamase superfamily)